MADTHITIEVHGDCTVIADRTQPRTYAHYAPLVAQDGRYTGSQIADAVKAGLGGVRQRGIR